MKKFFYWVILPIVFIYAVYYFFPVRKCHKCDGGNLGVCVYCKGKGSRTQYNEETKGCDEVICPSCKGSGLCVRCSGDGDINFSDVWTRVFDCDTTFVNRFR